jgi:hypothetical protein
LRGASAGSLARAMAKKSRTPPPPRRPVQAPRRRETRLSPEERRKKLLLVAFAGLGLVGLAVVIAVIALTGGSDGKSGDESVAAAMRQAGCTFRSVAAEPYKDDAIHVPTETTKVTWNTYPPAAGPHFGEWAVWGFYTDPVDPIRVVHNEEHGGVVLWWGEQTPQSQIAELRDFYNEDPESMFGTPIGTIGGKSLGSKVAITAWTGDPSKYGQNGDWGIGNVAVCPRFDESAFKKFRDAYRGRSPEGVDPSQNQPGQL